MLLLCCQRKQLNKVYRDTHLYYIIYAKTYGNTMILSKISLSITSSVMKYYEKKKMKNKKDFTMHINILKSLRSRNESVTDSLPTTS